MTPDALMAGTVASARSGFFCGENPIVEKALSACWELGQGNENVPEERRSGNRQGQMRLLMLFTLDNEGAGIKICKL